MHAKNLFFAYNCDKFRAEIKIRFQTGNWLLICIYKKELILWKGIPASALYIVKVLEEYQTMVKILKNPLKLLLYIAIDKKNSGEKREKKVLSNLKMDCVKLYKMKNWDIEVLKVKKR